MTGLSDQNRALVDDWLGTATLACGPTRFDVQELETLMNMAREQGRAEVRSLGDPELARKAAEKLVRPYLTTAAVWGVTPSHHWRNREMDPWHLTGAIELALQAAYAPSPAAVILDPSKIDLDELKSIAFCAPPTMPERIEIRATAPQPVFLPIESGGCAPPIMVEAPPCQTCGGLPVSRMANGHAFGCPDAPQ